MKTVVEVHPSHAFAGRADYVILRRSQTDARI